MTLSAGKDIQNLMNVIAHDVSDAQKNAIGDLMKTLLLPENMEAITAFMEKRKPDFI